jgi:hypothetical protein
VKNTHEIGENVKRISPFIILLGILISAVAYAQNLSPESDELLYQKILNFKNGSAQPLSLSGEEPQIVKCGTPYIISLTNQVRYASKRTQDAWLALLTARFDAEAPDTFGSSGGHFLIHYAAEGVHAIRIDNEFGVDPISGVPEYVESVASIYDSVWEYEINYLGYKEPPADSFYESGGDERFDVYLADLGIIDQDFLYAYGVTFPDVLTGPNNTWATAYQLLDNDYEGYAIYEDKPLEIIRATAAHEFFHVIQFGYDYFEYEDMNTEEDYYDDRHHWLEMSAVWMEEQVFDGVNDYYYYLPYYFPLIHRSLQTNNPGIYQYGAVVWPLYLSQKWGDNIIRRIWQKCEEVPDPNAFQSAIPEAIDEYSNSTYTFEQALSEFYIWIYFTGDRVRPNIGFDEAENWPHVPDQVVYGNDTVDYMLRYDSYPFAFAQASYQFLPDHLGGFYVRLSGFGQLDSTLHMKFWGLDSKYGNTITWNNRIVAWNPHIASQSIYVDPTIYSDSFSTTISEEILNSYDEVILVLSPFTNLPVNRSLLNRLTFTLNIADTSAPVTEYMISDPYPNPYVLSADENQQILVEVFQPEPQDIKMQIFNLAGERVYEADFEAANTVERIAWNGKNESGEMVASGLYIMYISAGDIDKITKIAVIE